MDEVLEKAIDEVGRDRVFARARAHGWVTHAAPPKWVWWGIVTELRNADAPAPASWTEAKKEVDEGWER